MLPLSNGKTIFKSENQNNYNSFGSNGIDTKKIKMDIEQLDQEVEELN